MSEATQDNATLEQTLNRTDLGHYIYEYKNLFFGVLIAVLVGAAGWSLWNHSRQNQAMEASVQVFKFQNEAWANAKAGKASDAELVKAFDGLSKDVQESPLMVPMALEMGKYLFEKGAVTEADAILSKLKDIKHPVPSFFVTMQRAVVLEKLAQTPKAIELLEAQSKKKDSLMPARVALELGRLYMIQGEKAKAQSQFETVVGSYPNDEQAKLAKLYLSRLAQ